MNHFIYCIEKFVCIKEEGVIGENNIYEWREVAKIGGVDYATIKKFIATLPEGKKSYDRPYRIKELDPDTGEFKYYAADQ